MHWSCESTDASPNRVVSIGDGAASSVSPRSTGAVIANLCRLLSEDSESTSAMDLVPHARMPLLKAKMHSTDAKITLSPLPLAEIPAHQTAELISKAFAELPHAQKLVLLMKALLRDDNYLGPFFGVHSGGVSSYTITLMVIAFCKFQVCIQSECLHCLTFMPYCPASAVEELECKRFDEVPPHPHGLQLLSRFSSH